VDCVIKAAWNDVDNSRGSPTISPLDLADVATVDSSKLEVGRRSIIASIAKRLSSQALYY
jgi:hypothetical protein